MAPFDEGAVIGNTLTMTEGEITQRNCPVSPIDSSRLMSDTAKHIRAQRDSNCKVTLSLPCDLSGIPCKKSQPAAPSSEGA